MLVYTHIRRSIDKSDISYLETSQAFEHSDLPRALQEAILSPLATQLCKHRMDHE